jgi:RNA polymerase sigma factor (sigma-70 family)
LTDGQLLGCFIERRDEAAFEALVLRHGPMVLGVCRRVLCRVHDAEDAFQATFLVLARKAASLCARELVGNWLYGSAYRTALEARARRARRRARERQVEDMPESHVEPEPAWRELLPLLDQELHRLPDKYRVPTVLCELEGKSRKEVAQLLRVPEGTLSWRLAHARKLLARRLARYGLTVSGAALAEATAPACVPRTLAASTAMAAGQAGAVPAQVMVLTEGVMKTMLLTRLKTLVAVTFVLLASAGAVGLSYRPAAAQPGDAPRALADDLEELRLEVAALRKGLQANRERVKALENEVQALKKSNVQEQRMGNLLPAVGNPNAGLTGSILLNERNIDFQVPTSVSSQLFDQVFRGAGQELRTQPAPDPLADAEAALKKPRQNPADKQAVDTLQGALRRLKESKNSSKKP